MVIIYGTRLMGKVDRVEALGHVATQFFHLYYVPLIPTGSYLVLSEQGDDFRGVSVPLSFKSIVTAWLRAGTFLGFVVLTILTIIAVGDQKNGLGPAILNACLAALCLGTFVATYYISWFTKASYERAMQIASLVGLSDEARLMLEVSYGRKTAEQADWELQQIESKREQEVVTPSEYFN
jgi:hypothetical protein